MTLRLSQPASSRRHLRPGKDSLQRPFALEFLDDRQDYGEDRYVIIGMAEGQVLSFIAYTERDERVRIISARRATGDE